MDREFEYYKVNRSNDNTIPLLTNDKGNPMYQYKKEPVVNPKLSLLKLGLPIPPKPKLADYMSLPSSVISKKIFNILAPLKIEGIQLLPAQITGLNNEIFNDYWLLHIYNRIKCIDINLSDCKVDGATLQNIQKIRLDHKVLEKIPLKNRLIFRLSEDFNYQLFHISIVEAILAIKPEGIRFVNIESWNDSSFFE